MIIGIRHEWHMGFSCAIFIWNIMNEYELANIYDHRVFDFLDGTHNVFEWLGTLLYYRFLDLPENVKETARFFIDNFFVDFAGYDFVIGYRADDNYFSIATRFLSGSFDIPGLKRNLAAGRLGEQIVAVSDIGYEALEFIGATDIRDDFHAYLCSSGQRLQQESRKVTELNSHRGFHVYDLIQAYEDLNDAQDEHEREQLEALLVEILEEGRIERKE